MARESAKVEVRFGNFIPANVGEPMFTPTEVEIHLDYLFAYNDGAIQPLYPITQHGVTLSGESCCRVADPEVAPYHY
jgi:hypothetical protein